MTSTLSQSYTNSSTTSAEQVHTHEWKDISETTFQKKEKCKNCDAIKINDTVYLPVTYKIKSATDDT